MRQKVICHKVKHDQNLILIWLVILVALFASQAFNHPVDCRYVIIIPDDSDDDYDKNGFYWSMKYTRVSLYRTFLEQECFHNCRREIKNHGRVHEVTPRPHFFIHCYTVLYLKLENYNAYGTEYPKLFYGFKIMIKLIKRYCTFKNSNS